MGEDGKEAILLVGNSKDANLFWATGLRVADNVIFIQMGGERILFVDTLEVERAERDAWVDKVVNLQVYKGKYGLTSIEILEVTPLILKELRVNTIIVPGYFPCGLYEVLKNKGFSLKIKKEPLFEERAIKTEQEIEAIIKTQRATEEVLGLAIKLIKESSVDGDFIRAKKGIHPDFSEGEILTSEKVRGFVAAELYKKGYSCEAEPPLIISSGPQTSIPQDIGSGPLRPNSPIIIDIYPRSIESGYYADITRTVFKGDVPFSFKRLYQTVLEGQEKAISMIREGIDGIEIHQEVENFFESQGYKTYKTAEPGIKVQGFIHSTGHGLGLEIHESPRIRPENWILKKGNVVTVEPGLYFPESGGVRPEKGGVRIEDLLVVTKNGCRNLTEFPKDLDSMIV